jgi:hypothetical protein
VFPNDQEPKLFYTSYTSASILLKTENDRSLAQQDPELESDLMHAHALLLYKAGKTREARKTYVDALCADSEAAKTYLIQETKLKNLIDEKETVHIIRDYWQVVKILPQPWEYMLPYEQYIQSTEIPEEILISYWENLLEKERYPWPKMASYMEFLQGSELEQRIFANKEAQEAETSCFTSIKSLMQCLWPCF